MNPREMTLEQMQERETARIAFQKEKTEKAILKLSERAKNVDEKEAKRLNKIVDNFKSHKTSLEKKDVIKEAQLRFDKIQERMKPLKEIPK